MSTAAPDYAALAAKAGGVPAAPTPDYAALAAKYGGAPAPQPPAAPDATPTKETLGARASDAWERLKRGANNLVGAAATSLAEIPQNVAKIPGLKQINALDPTAKFVGPEYARGMSAIAPPDPNSRMAKIGRLAEQMGEMAAIGPEDLGANLLREGVPRALGRIGANAAISGGDAALHGQPVGPAAAFGAGGAALGETVPALARGLKNTAGKQMLRAIYPTGAADKFAARNIVNGVLDRGIYFRNSDSLARQGAEGAQLYGKRLGDALDNMISEANAPKAGQLLIGAGAPATEAVPLHEATAVVERPSMLQPAAENRFAAPVVLRQPKTEVTITRDPATGRMVRNSRLIDPGTNPPKYPIFSTSPASSLIPPDASWRNPAEQQAADFLDRLAEEGGNGVTYPNGKMPEGAVTHPLKSPLRTTRTTESAQGVRIQPVATPPPGPIVERPLTATQPLIDDLERFKKGFTTSRGVPASPNHEAAMNYIGQLQDVLRAHGDHISYRDLNGLRRMYDEAVAARGGYSGRDLLSTMHASAEKQAANIFREELAKDHPDIAALNKEFSFWATVRNIGEHASLRKVGQQGGLGRTVTDPLLAVAGFGVGGPVGAGISVALNEAIRSPLWRSWSAVQKAHLADALASGNARQAMATLGRFAAAARGSREASRAQVVSLKGVGRLPQ